MFDEDLSRFFEEFAVEAVFKRAGAPVATANVIFNDPSQPVTVYETEVEEPAPFLLAPAAALADVLREDAVAVNGADYTVERIRPDGTGLVRMDLAEV
ncbi:MAG TPA: hypothetical protein VE713_12245 [Pyrinomonadaceae bacterium]|nr:hypothetical protein [Pyrinomonadaceae bacterium]